MAKSGRPQDVFGDRAKREGYPARSVYKLEEIDRRLGLLKRGMRVLDLGAYPGSWTIYAARKVDPGRVLGLDIQEFTGVLPKNAEMRHLDVNTLNVEELGGTASFDVVLSDMAPATIGARSADQYRSFELFMRALHIAETLCKPGGSFVAKIFQGQEFPEAKKGVQQRFEKVRIVKPEASRKESYEIFICGLGRRRATLVASKAEANPSAIADASTQSTTSAHTERGKKR